MIETQQHFRQLIKDYFVKLKFNEKEHKYTIDNRVLTSVSTIIKSFEKKTDWTKKAYEIAPYKNTTGKKLIKDWNYERDISIIRGHKTHNFGELLGPNCRKPETNQEIAIVRFWNTVSKDRYIRVDREIKMYHKHLYFSGTCDFLLYDLWTKSFILGDYKTNKDLFKNYRQQKLLYPFDYLLDQPLSKYKIQLSLYQILIEQLGIPVSERWIIWTLPDEKCIEKKLPLGSFKTYKAECLTSPLMNWLIKQNNFYYYEQ